MQYNNDDLKQDGYLNSIARRWARRMAGCLRNNKSKGPWVGKGAGNYATKLQAKLAELIAAGSGAADDAEAVCAAAADLAVLAHMFSDVVLDETADARKAKRKATEEAQREADQKNRAARKQKHLDESRAAADAERKAAAQGGA